MSLRVKRGDALTLGWGAETGSRARLSDSTSKPFGADTFLNFDFGIYGKGYYVLKFDNPGMKVVSYTLKKLKNGQNSS
ncbi:hypothetical protein LK494_08075 [Anaerovorax odorimutans]|nr:hypothetical protein [Anaerovorax odorimutans]